MDEQFFQDFQAAKNEIDKLDSWLVETLGCIKRIVGNLPSGSPGDQAQMTIQKAVLEAEISAWPEKVSAAAGAVALAELRFLAAAVRESEASGEVFLSTRRAVEVRLQALHEKRNRLTSFSRLHNWRLPLSEKLAEENELPGLTSEIFSLQSELAQAKSVADAAFSRAEAARTRAQGYGKDVRLPDPKTWLEAADRAALDARREAQNKIGLAVPAYA
jgi:hypothetical protein